MILELIGHLRRPGIAAVLVALTAPGLTRASEGQLITYLPFSTVAPQDIAHDASDGSYWVTAFLDNLVVHFSPGLTGEIGSFESPVHYPTGICYNPFASTLFVAGLLSANIVEVDRAGQPTGRVLTPDLDPVVNPNSAPSPRGMAFDRTGDGGLGSIYLVESMGTVIYEIGLDGRVIRSFIHPDDPDGYPGKGGTAPASDIDLIYEGGRLAGFYVNGGRNRVSNIRRLDLDGRYTGITIPIEDSGGTVSGILRQDFEPEPGRKVDAYVCVVESNARFAILEGGEPGFHEILDFACTSSGRELRLTWTTHQTYDAIEVLRDCDVLDTLPGNATEWRQTVVTEGVYELAIRARKGDRVAAPLPRTTVIGPGQVLRHTEVGGGFPIDIATGGDLLLVTDATERHIAIYDRDFGLVGTWEVPEAFAAEGEYITGIAYSPRDAEVYVFNGSTSNVAVLDDLGIVMSTFEARLPNLEESPEAEPDRGFVIGMDFDPAGDAGRGSLWLVESARDWIYEIDLAGNVLRDFPHPYLAIEPAPPETPYGAFTSGVALSSQGHLFLSGGALRDSGQIHIFRVDPATGLAIPGTAIPTDGLRAVANSGTFGFDATGPAESSLTVLVLAGKFTHLAEVRGLPFSVPPPTFPKATQPFHEDSAFISFKPNGAYEAIEVYRDCSHVATLPGDATSYLERPAPAGYHEYAVRGLKGGAASDFARAALRVGPGAVVARSFIWPARSAQQLTRDPGDGTFYLATNWYGDERKVYRYDSQLRFLGERESTVEPPWQIAALAVRAAPGGPREIFCVAWLLPVPIGETGSQTFLLFRETVTGQPLGKVPISLPRPTNGFVTFPTGLAWEPERDTFFLLERNSKTLIEMSPSGDILRTFPHPAPPFQNFVFNLGLTVDPQRHVIVLTGSERLDHKITRAREMTYDGVLTGFEVPLGELPGVVTGIASDGDDLVVVSGGSLSELMRLRAYSASPGRFLRGDADGSGALNLTDAIFSLNYLFRGGLAPGCEDAADADDNGTINLTDPIVVLTHLFASGPALPAPYPQAGGDPTADVLACSRG
jgi:DNA-binding beta-propeller fold protein YncE